MGEIKVKREKRKDSVSPYGDGIFFAVKGEKSCEASGKAAKDIVGIADMSSFSTSVSGKCQHIGKCSFRTSVSLTWYNGSQRGENYAMEGNR